MYGTDTSPAAAFAHEVAYAQGRLLGTWTEPDGVSTMTMAESRGLRHVFAWAPMLGMEHHVLVPFSLRSAAILAQPGPTWFAGSDEWIATWLRGHPAVATLGSRLSWGVTLAPGAPPMGLEWTVQLRPVGGVHGHLVMRVGDYGGRTAVSEMYAVVDAFAAAMGVPEPHAASASLAPSAFAPGATRALGIPMPSIAPPQIEARFVPMSGSMGMGDARRMVDAVSAQAPAITGASREDEHAKRVNAAGRAFLSGKTDEFIAIWESIARDLSDVGRRGEALQQIGSGYYAKKDYARAIQHYEAALAAGVEDVAEVQKDIASARKKMG